VYILLNDENDITEEWHAAGGGFSGRMTSQ